MTYNSQKPVSAWYDKFKHPAAAASTDSTPAETKLASLDDWGFEQPNLPETHTNYSVKPVSVQNDNAGFQADSKTILFGIATIIGVMLLLRVLKRTSII